MLENIDRFRKFADIKTVAMHSRPLSRWDNRLIFNMYDLNNFNLIGETYLSINHNEYLYIADSGRNWNSNRTVIWDNVNGLTIPPIKNGIIGLINYLTNNDLKIHLLIHPNRWNKKIFDWSLQYINDKIINIIKKIILINKKR